MKIVLLGYMGSGKSSVGALLSTALGMPLVDLDSHIASLEGSSITELFQHKGEIYFRKKEAETLKTLLSNSQNILLSTGGGTPCYGTVMQDLLSLNGILTIYLKCSVETLTQRLWNEKDQRPLISHIASKELLNDFIRKHLFERSFFYSQAHLTVVCDGITQKQVVEKILLGLF